MSLARRVKEVRTFPRKRTKLRMIIPSLAFVWLVAVGLGLFWLAAYETKPGRSDSPPTSWPMASQIERSRESPTLILFAHPRCPCTRASIGELSQIIARCRAGVATRVMFLEPTNSPKSWATTDLVRSAQAIPDVTVAWDKDGAEARLFGASTSGATLLYSSEGGLLFSGGITRSRGHSGDNLGRSAIESVLSGGVARLSQTPVFGCELHGRQIDGTSETEQ